MFVRNGRYVVGWGHQLADAPLLKRRVAGEQVVVFRKADGALAALQDRCCHRPAPVAHDAMQIGLIAPDAGSAPASRRKCPS